MAATVAVMLIFSMISTSMADWVRSKPLLGLLGVVSALMACGTAFGILMYCQLEFIGINLAAPFLMLGEYLLAGNERAERRGRMSSRKKGSGDDEKKA